MRDRVEAVIQKLRPALAGTQVVLQDVTDGVVKLEIYASGCHGGPPKEATLSIVEEELLEAIPEIKEVVAD